MLGKSQRTLDAYLKAGAAFRVFHSAAMGLIEDLQVVIPAKDIDVVVHWIRKIESKAVMTEGNMFSDFPDLSDDYLRVFDDGLTAKDIFVIDSRTNEIVEDLKAELQTDQEQVRQ